MKDGRFGECCSDGDRSPFNLEQGQHCGPVLMMGNLRGRVGKNLDLDYLRLLLSLLWALISRCGL